MMTYQNMSAFVAIIVHHCLKNLSDSQAESRSHMCSTSKSIQHRRSSESSCGLRSTRPPLFLKSHENRSPHESPKTSTSGHFWWWLAWYIQCVLSLRCQSRPRMSLAAACNGIEWVCRAECKHTLYEQAHEVTEQSQAHCTLTCRTRRPRCCFPWPQKHVEFISCWKTVRKWDRLPLTHEFSKESYILLLNLPTWILLTSSDLSMLLFLSAAQNVPNISNQWHLHLIDGGQKWLWVW